VGLASSLTDPILLKTLKTKRNVQLRHPEVEVYGNVAVVTGYTVGTITSPDGTARPIANRRTVVLIKQGGQWKIAHRHLSPVRLPQ